MSSDIHHSSGQPPKTVFVSRVYSSTAEKAFKAWTDPALLKKWFGPPDYHAEILTHENTTKTALAS